MPSFEKSDINTKRKRFENPGGGAKGLFALEAAGPIHQGKALRCEVERIRAVMVDKQGFSKKCGGAVLP